MVKPTATHALVEGQEMLRRTVVVEPVGRGSVVTVHVVPERVQATGVPAASEPAATQDVDEAHETAFTNADVCPVGRGRAATVHVVPERTHATGVP